MNKYENKQKKMITITLLVIFSIIFIGGLISGIVLIAIGKVKAGAIVSTITNFLSPTTILGIVIKWFMNKYFNKKNVNDTKQATIDILEQSGIKVPTTYKLSKKHIKNDLKDIKKDSQNSYGYV